MAYCRMPNLAQIETLCMLLFLQRLSGFCLVISHYSFDPFVASAGKNDISLSPLVLLLDESCTVGWLNEK